MPNGFCKPRILLFLPYNFMFLPWCEMIKAGLSNFQVQCGIKADSFFSAEQNECRYQLWGVFREEFANY